MFNVTNATLVLSSANVTVVYGNNGTITVFVGDTRATGSLELHINGDVYIIVLDGSESYTVKVNSSSWSVGSYVFNVTYAGYGNYSAAISPDYLFNVTNATLVLSSANVTVV